MTKQIITTAVVLIALTTAANGEGNSSFNKIPFYIYNAASRFDIDATLLYSICRVESQCTPRAINHDDGTEGQKAAGMVFKSYGMFQMKRATAESLGFVSHRIHFVAKIRHGRRVMIKVEEDCIQELLRPEISSYYAAKLVRRLYDRYGATVKVISAYNAGHAITGNKEYVNKVLKNFAKYKLDKRF